MTIATFLAQATTKPAAPDAGSALFQFLPLILIGIVFYMLMFRPGKVERDKHRKLIDALKKNDRVMTIGGMLGTVVQVKDDEITLKVDESTNTKITFSRSAIKTVLGAAPLDDKSA